MNKDAETILLILLCAFGLAIVAYFITKLIDAILHPSVVWFIIGVASVLVVEGLIWLGFYVRRRWFVKDNQSPNTKDD